MKPDRQKVKQARRVARERRTLELMMRDFCRARHAGGGTFCAECQELYDYAMGRLDRCPYGEEKPTCVKCPIHCYQAAPREQVREVMRMAGPRLLWRHPVLAILHVLDGRRPSPPLPSKRGP